MQYTAQYMHAFRTLTIQLVVGVLSYAISALGLITIFNDVSVL